MTEDEWKAVVLAIANEIDYDLYKQLLPDCAEGGPEEAEDSMRRCVMVGKSALKNPKRWLKNLNNEDS